MSLALDRRLDITEREALCSAFYIAVVKGHIDAADASANKQRRPRLRSCVRGRWTRALLGGGARATPMIKVLLEESPCDFEKATGTASRPSRGGGRPRRRSCLLKDEAQARGRRRPPSYKPPSRRSPYPPCGRRCRPVRSRHDVARRASRRTSSTPTARPTAGSARSAAAGTRRATSASRCAASAKRRPTTTAATRPPRSGGASSAVPTSTRRGGRSGAFRRCASGTNCDNVFTAGSLSSRCARAPRVRRPRSRASAFCLAISRNACFASGSIAPNSASSAHCRRRPWSRRRAADAHRSPCGSTPGPLRRRLRAVLPQAPRPLVDLVQHPGLAREILVVEAYN